MKSFFHRLLFVVLIILSMVPLVGIFKIALLWPTWLFMTLIITYSTIPFALVYWGQKVLASRYPQHFDVTTPAKHRRIPPRFLQIFFVRWELLQLFKAECLTNNKCFFGISLFAFGALSIYLVTLVLVSAAITEGVTASIVEPIRTTAGVQNIANSMKKP